MHTRLSSLKLYTFFYTKLTLPQTSIIVLSRPISQFLRFTLHLTQPPSLHLSSSLPYLTIATRPSIPYDKVTTPLKCIEIIQDTIAWISGVFKFSRS
jgi:hypothetical protein